MLAAGDSSGGAAVLLSAWADQPTREQQIDGDFEVDKRTTCSCPVEEGRAAAVSVLREVAALLPID